MSTTKTETDLLIIGGGVLGAFHALAALERGLSVLLLERDSMPRGATVRNFGQIVPSGMNAHWQKFGRESLRIYKALQEKIDVSVRPLGSVYIASDDEELGLLEELHAINAASDYPSELWTVERCRQRYPQLRSDYCRGGLYFPQEISVNPRRMIHQLHRYLLQHASYQGHFQTCVRDLVSDSDGRVTAVTTGGQKLTAQHAILCCGSEFKLLYPERFQTSGMEAVKLQMLRLSPQAGVSIPGNVLTGSSIRRYESFAQCPSWASIKSRESPNGFASQWGIHILFKQEADGGIIVGDSHEYAPASRIDDLRFDDRRDIYDYFVDSGRQIFNLPSWDIESTWCGIYCQTSDPSGIFTTTIDGNIHIVTGIGGKGMTSSAGFANHKIGEILND